MEDEEECGGGEGVGGKMGVEVVEGGMGWDGWFSVCVGWSVGV